MQRVILSVHEKSIQSHVSPAASRSVSSTEVARLAGVSQSSVSRVFGAGAGAGVSPAVRDKVLAAAAALNYHPNALPGILQTGKSGIVAIIIGGFYNPFFTRFLELLSAALRARKLQVMLVQADSDSALDEVVGDLARYRIDAVFSALAIRSEQVAEQLNAYKIPIVTLNSRIAGEFIGAVSSDNFGAGASAARFLQERGCTQVAYLAGRESVPQNERQKGFFEEALRIGLSTPLCSVAGFSYEEGYQGALAMRNAEVIPRRDFLRNDLVAFGAIDAIRHEWKLRVPEDVQIIGYDNIPMTAWRSHNVTTFDQNMTELVAGALALVDELPHRHTATVQPRIVERGTTLGLPSKG